MKLYPKQWLPYIIAGGFFAIAITLVVQKDESQSFQETAHSGESSSQRSAEPSRPLLHSGASSQATSQHDTAASSSSTTADSSTEEKQESLLVQSPILKPYLSRRGSRRNLRSSSRQFSIGDLVAANGVSVRDRVKQIESFRYQNSLSATERDGLIEVLNNGPAEGAITDDFWHWMVDEIISTLRADGSDNVQLTSALATLATDSGQQMIVRDYALQHLGHLQSEGGDLALIKDTLFEAVSLKEGTYAGTALLALQQDENLALALGVDAQSVAQDSSYDVRSRLTAMQVAGKQGNADVLPLAVTIANDASQPVALRMSAIATIGDLQAIEHTDLLQSFSPAREARLYTAAQAALQKLSQ